MAFVTEPRIELVGKPVIEIAGVMAFLNEHGYSWEALTTKLDAHVDLGDGDGEWLVEMAGRNCYQSWPKAGEPAKGRTHEDHIKHLIEIGHGSAIEHAAFNFAIWNISRSLSHELVRHRIGTSYSQLSQRYVDSSNVDFIVPPAIQELKQTQPEIYAKWVAHCNSSRDLYEELTASLANMYSDIDDKLERRKKARQAARSVLPNATETKIFVTMNARAVRHFIELRASEFADVEIRKLAVQMFQIMKKEFPLLAHGLELVQLPDGTQAVDSKHKRV